MDNVDSKKIVGMIGEQYHSPEWLSIPELRAGTGYSAGDEIDVFSISCFAKQGYGYSIAFEVKISRQDFLREVNSFDKNNTELCLWHNT